MRAIVLGATLALGCALEWPRLGPTPCGAAGQRCCDALDDAGARVSASGCDMASYCAPGSDRAAADAGSACRACPAGRVACDNRCVDTTSDGDHCGACGVACPLGQRCVRSGSSGACAHVCPATQTWCDEAAACVALLSSAEHCGRCGNACRFANANAACLGGACRVTSCAAGFGNCDGLVDNGCEADLRTDARNCGACRRACAGPVCVGGSCSN